MIALVLLLGTAEAAHTTVLNQQLTGIRTRVIELEEQLLESSRTREQARKQVMRVRELIKLQRQERDLGVKRLKEIERTVAELEKRRGALGERVVIQRVEIRAALKGIERSTRLRGTEDARGLQLHEREVQEAPRRKLLTNLASRGLREVETLRIDLADADQLEARIRDEKHHLNYLSQDLREQEGILELNRQLQADLIKKTSSDRLRQLESYRKLKASEAQVERLIKDFNARVELEKAQQDEKEIRRMSGILPGTPDGPFARAKGSLALPVVGGKISSPFGRTFDPKSQLYVFKKGIDIDVAKDSPVHVVAPGKLAFVGELPGYGKVAIIDHGDHYYSLLGRLGQVGRKQGELLNAGEVVATTHSAGTPLYFEIRARNVAVNPLQWFSN